MGPAVAAVICFRRPLTEAIPLFTKPPKTLFTLLSAFRNIGLLWTALRALFPPGRAFKDEILNDGREGIKVVNSLQSHHPTYITILRLYRIPLVHHNGRGER